MRLFIQILFFSLLLTSCSADKTAQSVFDNYLNRLSNSLKVEIEEIEVAGTKAIDGTLRPYPRKSSLVYEIPSVDINILQFLQLSKCELQRLIGHRNSSLGKLMTGYHTLLYEHEFLILAQQCRATLEPDESLYDELTKAIEHKQKYQNQVRWNETFAGNELRYLFSLGTEPLTPQQLSHHPTELSTALESLNTWLLEPSVNGSGLQQAYKAFEARKYIGELRLTMAMAMSKLAQADALLDQRLTQKPLCYNQRANHQSKIVNNVFFKFYIGEVQPMLAQLHQQGKAVFGLIDELQKHMATPDLFTEFWAEVYTSEDSEWQDFNAAIAKHTKSWQDLFNQCGGLPR